MKNLSSIVLVSSAFTLLCIASVGCTKESTGPDQIVGSGRVVSQERATVAFTGVRVTGIAKVIITQDSLRSVRVESDDNIISRVQTSVDQGVLVVGLLPGSYSGITVKVYVSMRSIEDLESIGTAEFLATGPIHAEGLLCRISGVGTVTLTGTAMSQTLEITGAGSVHNFDLSCPHSSVMLAGTGHIEVCATQQLDAVISGTGNILYSGNPQLVHQTVSGAGTIGPRP